MAPSTAFLSYMANCQKKYETLKSVLNNKITLEEYQQLWSDRWKLLPKREQDRYKKPRRTKSAYLYFMIHSRKEREKENRQLSLTHLSRFCWIHWKIMSPAEKRKFEKLAEDDQMRFLREMKDYIPPPAAEKRTRKKRVRKYKPTLPVLPFHSSYFWFCKQEKPKVKEMYPDMAAHEVARALDRLWKTMDPEMHKKYNATSINNSDL